jgi:hypothetical protein
MLALALTLVVAAEPVKLAPLSLYPDGGLWVATASEKQTIKGVVVPKGTTVSFDESGGVSMLTFETDTEWSGARWNADDRVDFDENGVPTGATRIKEFKSGGLTFAAGETLEFFPGKKGTAPKVQTGTIAGAQRFGDVDLAANSSVTLGANGKLLEAVSGKKQTFKGLIPIEANVRLTFHPNGMIASVTNGWGVGFYDEKGKATHHKEYAK